MSSNQTSRQDDAPGDINKSYNFRGRSAINYSDVQRKEKKQTHGIQRDPEKHTILIRHDYARKKKDNPDSGAGSSMQKWLVNMIRLKCIAIRYLAKKFL